MNHDPEKILNELVLEDAPPALRERTLEGVASELTRNTEKSGSEKWVGWMTAAAVVLAAVCNLAVRYHSEQRLANFDGSKPVPQPIADTVDSVREVASPELVEHVRRQLLLTQRNRHPDPKKLRHRFEQLMRELEDI